MIALFPLLIGIKHYKKIATVSLLGLINLYLCASIYYPRNHVEVRPENSLSAIVLNVNTRLGSPKRVESFILQKTPDIIVLEEIDQRWINQLPQIIDAYSFRHIRTRDDNFGIGLFSKIPLINPRIKYFNSHRLPSISAEIQTSSGSLKIIATHTLPPRNSSYALSSDAHLAKLAAYIQEQQMPVLLLGDLNTTPFSPKYKTLLKAAELIDSAKSYGYQPTWPTFASPLLIPIDHVLHSEGIRITKKEIGPKTGSDHYPLIVEFNLVQPLSNDPAVK